MPALDQPSHEAYAWDSGSLGQDIINSPLGQDIIKALNVASIPARVSGEGAINFFMREFVDPFHAPEDRTTTLLQNSVEEFTQEHRRPPNLLEFTDLSDRAINMPWGVRGAVQAAVDPLNVVLPGVGSVLGLGKGVPKIVAKQALNRMPTQAPVRGAGGAMRGEVADAVTARRAELDDIYEKARLGEQFLETNIRPVFRARFGSVPDMSVVRVGEEEILFVRTPGWEGRVEEIGFTRAPDMNLPTISHPLGVPSWYGTPYRWSGTTAPGGVAPTVPSVPRGALRGEVARQTPTRPNDLSGSTSTMVDFLRSRQPNIESA